MTDYQSTEAKTRTKAFECHRRKDTKGVFIEKTFSHSMRTNFSWSILGNIVYGACQWGYLVVLAKLTSPEVLGRFSLGLAVSAPVVMFLNLQLHIIQATDAKDDYGFPDYLGLRLLTNTFALSTIVVIALFSDYAKDVKAIIIIVGLGKTIEATSDILMGWLQKIEVMEFISKSLILRGTLSVVGLATVIYLTRSLIWGTISLAIIWAAVLVCYDLRNCRNTLKTAYQRGIGKNTEIPIRNQTGVFPRWNWKKIRKIVSLTFPLGLVTLLMSLNTNIPRYFIEDHLGDRGLGMFTSLAYLILVGSKVVEAIGQVSIPRLALYYTMKYRLEYVRLFLRVTGICVGIGIIGVLGSWFFGKKILNLLYGPEYGENWMILVWIMLSGGFQYLAAFLWQNMMATRKIRIQLPLNLIYVCILTGFCAILIPKYGIQGAAYALFLSAVVQAVGNGVATFQSLRSFLDRKDTYG